MTTYDKNNLYYASIKERYSLCKPGSGKETQHIVLDLKGSGINYAVGDSVAIYPENDPELVKKTLEVMGADGTEIVNDKRSGEKWELKAFLTKKAGITEFSKKFVTELAKRQINSEKKAALEAILEESFKDYQANRELWDALHENTEVRFEIQELCDLLMPLMPRFYSISSSRNIVGEEVHLTVALLSYKTNEQLRRGVCTHYLCNLAPLNQPVIPLYFQSGKEFTVPEDHNIPIIMVGPGTGIAPFRAFMQERALKPGSQNWLFFGEWYQNHNFFYEDYWSDLQQKGSLKMDLAFSRDREQKVYVQHKMIEAGKEIYDWLQKGARFYVCGNASCMAKDVDAALHRIVQEHGALTEEETKAFVKQLRHEKRYLRDVY
jgi:sulfite reductase (NADPH) flavoprotein alpha-component